MFHLIKTNIFDWFAGHICPAFFVWKKVSICYTRVVCVLCCQKNIMNPDFWLIVVWIVIWVLFWYLIARIYFLITIKKQRSNAVSRSRNVVLGYVHEKIAPLLPNFPYSYKDLVFLWKGVDYLVLDWLSRGNLSKIVFLEIKSGASALNKNEQMVKECVGQKRISYEIWKNET